MVDVPPEPPTHSPEQLRAFRAEFTRRRERQRKAGALFAGTLGLLVGAGVLLRLPESGWVPLVGVVALAALVFSLANWKCPACGSRLGRRGDLTSCRECGLRLE